MSHKTTYHTDVLFRFRLGLLPRGAMESIPHSTRHGWKSRDLSRIVGCEHAITEDNLAMMREFLGRKKLLAAAKAIWHLYHTLLAIASSLRDFHKTLRRNRQQVTEAVTRCASALREDVDIRKLIAQLDIRASNSMIEAVNKRLKYDFLYRLRPPDFESLLRLLPDILEQYNSKPLHVLHGLTPKEVLNGQSPDKSRIQALISQARQARREQNQKSDCSFC